MSAAGGSASGHPLIIADREYFTRALAGEPAYVSDAFRARAGGNPPIIAMSVPLQDGAGRVRGVVAGAIALEPCRQCTWDFATVEAASIVVLDREARVVYSSSPDRKPLDAFNVEPRDGVGPGARTAVRCDRLVEQRREAGFASVCEPVANGWTVLVELPEHVALRGVTHYLWIMVGLFGAGIALAVGLAQLFGRRITGPLERLASSVRRYEPGLTGRAVAIGRRSPAEVADLVNGFEAWQQRVEEHTRLLVHARHDLEQDIAQRVRAEDEAARLRERLAHVSRVASMGDMAAGIAHEINQPLTAIAAYAMACARLIRSGGLRQEQVLETLDYIGEEALRAGSIIHGVRAMVRGQPSARTPCDVNRLIADAARLARVDPRLQDLQLRLELTERLFPVLVDGVQIQQVLLNLIVNGAEATERGNGAGEIVVRTSQDESTVCVSVTDRGAGLSPAVEKELFRPFFTTKQAGMGMGLSISRTIIEYHGGRLWFTPNEPRGTTFHFALPRA
jgi:C4-dicarboxylate-specific signal transduction histidine kinase